VSSGAERAPWRAGRRLLAGPLEVGRDSAVRFFGLQGIDRATALAGQAFTALVPLLIVYGAFMSRADGRDFADQLVQVFHLRGSTAASLRSALAPANTVEDEASALGAVLLVFSALSFTRALQRLYRLAWDQPSLGLRAAKWGLAWLAIVVVVLTVRPIVLGGLHGVPRLVVSLVIVAALWLLTPYVLLGTRIAWRRLIPTALLTAAGMTALEVSSALWMPRTVAASARQFGVIGVAFALLSWLVAAGLVLVAAAAGGRAIDTGASPGGVMAPHPAAPQTAEPR
jgi:membrane protein